MSVALSIPVALPAQGRTQVKDDRIARTPFSFHEEQARADVRRAAGRYYDGSSFELIFTPGNPVVRLQNMATNTHVDLSSGRCRKARRLKKAIRAEAAAHNWVVEFKTDKKEVVCEHERKKITLLYATFIRPVAQVAA